MAQVTVADDVLSAQPNPVRELDIEALTERDVEEWVIDHWQSDVRFLVLPDRPHPATPSHADADAEARLEAGHRHEVAADGAQVLMRRR